MGCSGVGVHVHTPTHTGTQRLGWSSGSGDTQEAVLSPPVPSLAPLTCWGWAGVWGGRWGQGPSGILRFQ